MLDKRFLPAFLQTSFKLNAVITGCNVCEDWSPVKPPFRIAVEKDWVMGGNRMTEIRNSPTEVDDGLSEVGRVAKTGREPPKASTGPSTFLNNVAEVVNRVSR